MWIFAQTVTYFIYHNAFYLQRDETVLYIYMIMSAFMYKYVVKTNIQAVGLLEGFNKAT